MIDGRILELLSKEFTPLDFDEESPAFDTQEKVGHGGHFLGTAGTGERFQTWFSGRSGLPRTTATGGRVLPCTAG